jgi:hypothetical protein
MQLRWTALAVLFLLSNAPSADAAFFGARTMSSLRALRSEPEEQKDEELPVEVDKHLDDVNKGLEDTKEAAMKSRDAKKLQNAQRDVPRDLQNDVEELYWTFLPGFRPNPKSVFAIFMGILIAPIWFWFYFSFCYSNDRVDSAGATEEASRELWDEHEDTLLMGFLNRKRFLDIDVPGDMIMVFHHPSHDSHTDFQTEYPVEFFHDVIRLNRGLEGVEFPRWSELMRQEETPDGKKKPKMVSYEDARKAFLQDLFVGLGKFGFKVQAFSSIDGDEIFVSASLEDASWMHCYLTETHAALAIQDSVIDQLGLGDCAYDEAKDPPMVTYDPLLCKRFKDMGYTDSEDPRSFYKSYKARDPAGELLGSKDRFFLLLQMLSKTVNLDRAQHTGLMLMWYPAHRMQYLHRIATTWSRIALYADFTFVQPIKLIYDYFGPRIAFMSAWTGMYCKALLAMVPVVIVWEFTAKLQQEYFGFEGARRQVMAFSLIIIAWTRIASNYWQQEQDFYTTLWELDQRVEQGVMRPQFEGTLTPTLHDDKEMDLEASPRMQNIKMCISYFITIIAILIVAFCIFLWVTTFAGKMSLFSSIMLSIQIKVFEFIFNILADVLNEFENHKYPSEFYNSMLYKHFMFAFVNNYWAFFYLAIKQRHTKEGCPVEQGGCFEVMRMQLTMTMIILAVARAAQVVVQCFVVRLMIWLEDRGLRQNLTEGKELPKRGFAEEQAKYADFSQVEQIQTIIQSVIPLGFVIMFGCVAPIIIPFAFLVFVVQLRSTAFFLVTSCKRPIPRKANSMGGWMRVIGWLEGMGVAFSAFLLMYYGNILAGEQLITKLTVVLIYLLVVCILCGIVDSFIPRHSNIATVLTNRRRAVCRNIFRISAESEVSKKQEKAAPRAGSRQLSTHEAIQADGAGIVLAGKWDDIRSLEKGGAGIGRLKRMSDLTGDAVFSASTPPSSPRQ